MESQTYEVGSKEWMSFAYDPNPPELGDDARQVLETYSKIAPEDLIPHVTQIREKAFKIFPYPCIGRWRFLNLAIGRHPQYEEIKRRMLSGNEIFLDLGCAFAQDVRRLVADGVDSSKCYGTDLSLPFIDLGYELFQDRETLKTRFVQADIFAGDGKLSELYGRINIINASSFFHLFSWEKQKHIASHCVKLWTGQEGDLLVGRQVGNEVASEYEMPGGRGLRHIHNVESWQMMWKEIGDESGAEFDVQAKLLEWNNNAVPQTGLRDHAQGRKLLIFSVRRVK